MLRSACVMRVTFPSGIVLVVTAAASICDACEWISAGVSKAMPLGNVTGMTQSERNVLGRWIRQGAKIP